MFYQIFFFAPVVAIILECLAAILVTSSNSAYPKQFVSGLVESVENAKGDERWLLNKLIKDLSQRKNMTEVTQVMLLVQTKIWRFFLSKGTIWIKDFNPLVFLSEPVMVGPEY